MKKGTIYEGIVKELKFPNQGVVEINDGKAVVKNTIPGDLPSCGLNEIDRIIKNHKNTGVQLEMDR